MKVENNRYFWVVEVNYLRRLVRKQSCVDSNRLILAELHFTGKEMCEVTEEKLSEKEIREYFHSRLLDLGLF